MISISDYLHLLQYGAYAAIGALLLGILNLIAICTLYSRMTKAGLLPPLQYPPPPPPKSDAELGIVRDEDGTPHFRRSL